MDSVDRRGRRAGVRGRTGDVNDGRADGHGGNGAGTDRRAVSGRGPSHGRDRGRGHDAGGDEGGSAGRDGVGDPRRALGEFLRARRGRVAPEQVGLAGGGRRRVRGLRREELAQLAGISVDYYVRLEQGRATQPSPEVLDALARALDLDAAERGHLATLAGARRAPVPSGRASPLLRRILDGMARFPAFATNHRLDIVAWNSLGAELMGGLGDPGRRDHNNARFLFLDPAARDLHTEWEARAVEEVGQLRASAGRYPDDEELAALITELSARSGEFRRIWATGEVVVCAAGRKRLWHPVVGSITLDYETLHVPAAPGETGLYVHVFAAEEGSEEEATLARLAGVVGEGWGVAAGWCDGLSVPFHE